MADSVEDLYRSDKGRVVRLAYLLTGDRSVAEEIAQEAFSRLIPRFASLERPSAFLTTVVVNLCRDRGRREGHAARHPWDEPAPAPAPDLPPDLGEVWLAVQQLPQSQREAVVLRFWADLTTKDIARLLDTPAGTVRSLLHRAMRTLHKELDHDH